MTDNPLPTTNPVESAIDTAIADATNVGEQTIDKAAETAQPWLAFPVIKQLFESLVAWIVGTLSKTGQLALTFGINKGVAAAEGSALQKAEADLQSAIKSGDQDAIRKAEIEFQKAQSDAANSGGSAHPQ